MIYNGCIEQEQMSYNSLKSRWATLPQKTRSYCDEIARFSEGSYMILSGCVDMENSAASEANEFKF